MIFLSFPQIDMMLRDIDLIFSFVNDGTIAKDFLFEQVKGNCYQACYVYSAGHIIDIISMYPMESIKGRTALIVKPVTTSGIPIWLDELDEAALLYAKLQGCSHIKYNWPSSKERIEVQVKRKEREGIPCPFNNAVHTAYEFTKEV